MGIVSALAAGAYTTTFHVLSNIVKGGGRAPRTLTSLGKYFHRDRMYAIKHPLPCTLPVLYTL